MAAHTDLSHAGPVPDHALGQYQAWRAPCDVRAPLDLAWTSVARSASPAAHRLLPHGEPSIALLRRSDESGALCELEIMVCGPYYQGRFYRPAPREELIAWRIKPEVAAALFAIAPEDYCHAAMSAASPALKQACARTLSIGANAAAGEILATLNSDLNRFAVRRAANAGPEVFAAQWLRDSDGQMRLRDIAARLDVSERHLRRRFIDHVGCAPKAYARQLQITAAALAAEKAADPDWAEIAAGAGFHDQPHMINAFRAALGMTPTAFHAERRALI